MRHFDTVLRICASAFATLYLLGTANARSITVLPGTPAASINVLIETSRPGDRIMMGEGVFNFDETLIIAKDGVSIVPVKGSGEDGFGVRLTGRSISCALREANAASMVELVEDTAQGETEITATHTPQA